MADDVSLHLCACSLAIAAIALAMLILACVWPLDAGREAGLSHHFAWFKRGGGRHG